MNPLNALMPLIATLSSPAQAAPPAIVAPPAMVAPPATPDPMQSYEQWLGFQPPMPSNVNAPPKYPALLAPKQMNLTDQLKPLQQIQQEAAISKKISKGYSPDPEYQKKIDKAMLTIPNLAKKDWPLRDSILQFATDNKIDPPSFLAQVIHETSGLKRYPSLNPGGIKPSDITTQFINSQPDDSRDQVARKLTQVQGTRENLTSNVKDLKSYFSHPDSKFESPKKEQDIRQLTNEQLAGLNEKLASARKTKDWQALADEVDSLKQLFPDGKNKNKFFWVTQPFMRYENREDGFRDMLRARGSKKDRSTWNLDATGNINRMDEKGNLMGIYKGTK